MKSGSGNSFSKMISIGNALRRSSSVSYLPEPLRGLNVTQMSTLSFISEHEQQGVFQKDIESYLRIRRSSVSTLLYNLEKCKLIVRVPVPEDARLKRVMLTEDGRELCRTVDWYQGQVEQFMGKILSEQEQEMLATMLEKIMFHIDEFHAKMEERGEKTYIERFKPESE